MAFYQFAEAKPASASSSVLVIPLFQEAFITCEAHSVSSSLAACLQHPFASVTLQLSSSPRLALRFSRLCVFWCSFCLRRFALQKQGAAADARGLLHCTQDS